MNPVYVQAVSILGPGLPDWETTRSILRGEREYEPAATPAVSCTYLSPNVKRRTTRHMQIALHAAEKALQQTDLDPVTVELLFASADGDQGIADEILTALTKPEKMVSPQKFQNVILNAAIGHLGIILGNQQSATAISAGTYSFAAGLLHAATSAIVENHPVLFVCYDEVGTERTDPRDGDIEPASIALLLSPEASTQSIARLVARIEPGNDDTELSSAPLESLRKSLGTYRSLSFLAGLANLEGNAVRLPHCEKTVLTVELAPCQ